VPRDMNVEKIYVEADARYRLERLCDAKHPQEVGGYLLGEAVADDTVIRDIFPVPNVALKTDSTYQAHGWGASWADLYSQARGLSQLGQFHSHPNGAIPSARDMEACPQLHLWVIHHARGQHTYHASRDYRDRAVVFFDAHGEAVMPRFLGDDLHLGTIRVDNRGRLQGDALSTKLVALKDETRRLLFLSWQNVAYGDIDLDRVARQSGRTKATLRKHLTLCLHHGLLEKGWKRGHFKVIPFEKLT
jgi:proteasome lid subunit RPN8/RPN11